MSTYAFKNEALASRPLTAALLAAGEGQEGLEISLASETSFTELARRVLLDVIEGQNHVVAVKETIAGLRARQAQQEARIERGRAALLDGLETVGLKTLRLPEGTISAGRGQPNVVITDEALVPTRYRHAAPQVEQAFEQLLRAAAYAAANGHAEMQADFHNVAMGLLALFQLDKKAITAALKNGEQVAGAALGNGSSWLVVRS